MRPRALALLAAPFALSLLVGGCDLSMKHQARYDVQGPAPLFPHGSAQLNPPPGTVAEGDVDPELAAAQPPPATPALLARGQERFEIFCTPCHGRRGDGDGVVVQRGFPQPPSYYEPRLRDAPAAHFYDVITSGYGVMFPYGQRVAPADRWAITAYIRALQLARPVAASALRSPTPTGTAPAARGG